MIKTYHDIEKAVIEFRKQNNLSLIEPIRLKSLLQRNNVLTVYLPLSDNFYGMAAKIKEEQSVQRFMLINSNTSIGKQHFTICHELYHLYIQEDFKNEQSWNIGRYDKTDPEEYNADCFASFLLLPPQGVLAMIPEKERTKNCITLNTILEIEQYYACSRSALLYCLQKKLSLIDNKFYELFNKNIRKKAQEYGFPSDLYKSGNEGIVIGDYGSKARRLFEDQLISESRYISFLDDIGIDLTKSDSDDKEDC